MHAEAFLSSTEGKGIRMEKHRVVITLRGIDYVLRTDRSEEQTVRIATFLDRRMRDMAKMTHASEEMVSVLTSLTICEELMRMEAENTEMHREIDMLKKQLREAEARMELPKDDELE